MGLPGAHYPSTLSDVENEKRYGYTLVSLPPTKVIQSEVVNGHHLHLSLRLLQANQKKTIKLTEPTPYSADTYKPLYPASEMGAAKASPLASQPTSEGAKEACALLLSRILQPHGQKVINSRLQAFGALIADLLSRDPDDQGGWLYRSMDPEKFTGATVGYRPFYTVFKALDASMLDRVRGNRVWGPSQMTKSGRIPLSQRATRFRATPWLRGWFAERGISRETWSEHFTEDRSGPAVTKATSPVVLRGSKPPRHFGAPKGRDIPIDRKAPVVAALIARMDRINRYLSTVKVEPHGSVFLRRIFANGDLSDHAWSQGGRMYALGSSSYQVAKKEARKLITIDGQPTCEIDIQASHLTILAGLGYIPAFAGDPYILDGLPRPVVKRWVNMTLSHGKRHLRWPGGAKKDLLKDHDLDLEKDFPIKATGDEILRHLPILKDDNSSSVAVGWGELQFRESELVLACIEDLAFKHDIPALPVHDSLIVTVDAKDSAVSALKAAFKKAVGAEPVVE